MNLKKTFFMFFFPLIAIQAQQVENIAENVAVDLSTFAQLNNIVYFAADNNLNGKELWRSDGTKSGTYLLKDIYEGSRFESSFPKNFGNVIDKIYFTAYPDKNNYNTSTSYLFFSNGTKDGTVWLNNFKNPSNFVNFNNQLFFISTVNNELVVSFTNGTIEGTQISLNKVTSGYNLYLKNGNLYLNQPNGVYKFNLTTKKLELLAPLDKYSNLKPYKIIPTKDQVYLVYQIDFNKFDLVSYDSPKNTFIKLKTFFSFQKTEPVIYENSILFIADDGNYGLEPWQSDGTISGTKMIKDISKDGGSSLSQNHEFWFSNNIVLFDAVEQSPNKSYGFIFDFKTQSLKKLTDGNGNIFRSINDNFANPLTTSNKIYFTGSIYNFEPDFNTADFTNTDFLNKLLTYDEFIFDLSKNVVVRTDGIAYDHTIIGEKVYSTDATYALSFLLDFFIPGAFVQELDLNTNKTTVPFFFPKNGIKDVNLLKTDLVIKNFAIFNGKAISTFYSSNGLFTTKSCGSNSEIKNNNNSFDLCSNSSGDYFTTNLSAISTNWYFDPYGDYFQNLGNVKTQKVETKVGGRLFLVEQTSNNCYTIDMKYINIKQGGTSVNIVGNNQICSSNSSTLKGVSGNGQKNLEYRWFLDSKLLTNENKDSLITKLQGIYKVEVKDTQGCISTSPNFEVTQKPSPDVTITKNASTDILTGGNVVLSVPSATNQSYQWLKNSLAINGATNNSYTASEAGKFSVTVNRNGCIATSEAISVNIILANELPNTGEFKVFPNPVENSIKVHFLETIQKTAKLHLISSSGTIIKKWTVNQQENILNVSEVPNGIYLLQVEFNGKNVIQKLFKNN